MSGFSKWCLRDLKGKSRGVCFARDEGEALRILRTKHSVPLHWHVYNEGPATAADLAKLGIPMPKVDPKSNPSITEISKAVRELGCRVHILEARSGYRTNHLDDIDRLVVLLDKVLQCDNTMNSVMLPVSLKDEIIRELDKHNN